MIVSSALSTRFVLVEIQLRPVQRMRSHRLEVTLALTVFVAQGTTGLLVERAQHARLGRGVPGASRPAARLTRPHCLVVMRSWTVSVSLVTPLDSMESLVRLALPAGGSQQKGLVPVPYVILIRTLRLLLRPLLPPVLSAPNSPNQLLAATN